MDVVLHSVFVYFTGKKSRNFSENFNVNYLENSWILLNTHRPITHPPSKKAQRKQILLTIPVWAPTPSNGMNGLGAPTDEILAEIKNV